MIVVDVGRTRACGTELCSVDASGLNSYIDEAMSTDRQGKPLSGRQFFPRVRYTADIGESWATGLRIPKVRVPALVPSISHVSTYVYMYGAVSQIRVNMYIRICIGTLY